MTRKKDQAAAIVEFFEAAPLATVQIVFGIVQAIMRRRVNADPPTRKPRQRVNTDPTATNHDGIDVATRHS